MTEWYDVVGYEKFYQITKDGVVRSKSRKVNSPICGGSRVIKPKIFKNRLIRGYPATNFCVNGTIKTKYIHRLLAINFIKNSNNRNEINHIDGNPLNNNLSNLEWCTHKENMEHAVRLELMAPSKIGPGVSSPAAKLDNDKVYEIRAMAEKGNSQKRIADYFGVTKGTIGFIVRHETWAHI